MHFLPLLYMAFGFLVYVLIIFCLLKIKNHHFLSTDPKPKFHPLSELEVEQDISKIYSIKTGIVIEEFQQFDVLHNQFSMSCLVWFQFNPNLVSLETIEKFSFLTRNAQALKNIKMKSVWLVKTFGFNTRLNFILPQISTINIFHLMIIIFIFLSPIMT